jgi:hypothetical protein
MEDLFEEITTNAVKRPIKIKENIGSVSLVYPELELDS